MKCPQCRQSLLQHVSEDVTRIRVTGALYMDRAIMKMTGSCYWCRAPVAFDGFVPGPRKAAAKPQPQSGTGR